jgi:hypothetical protein
MCQAVAAFDIYESPNETGMAACPMRSLVPRPNAQLANVRCRLETFTL